MSLRFFARILPVLSAILALAAMLGAGAVVLLGEREEQRLDASRSQLEALYAVDGAASRYGRQAVDQLLFGYDRSGPLQDARNEMERALASLTRVTRDEMNALSGEAELQAELPEVEQVRRVVDLYHAIDASATSAFRIMATDAVAARDTVERQVDFRLTNELQPLVASSIADERAELQTQLDLRAAWRSRVLVISGVAALAAVVLAVLVLARRRGELERQLSAAAANARHAGERLVGLNEARAKLLADIGHQLRTPLTVLRGEADVALRGHASADQLIAALGRVRTQAAELGNLLGGFIAAARQSGDSPAMVTAPTAIDEVVAAAANDAAVLLDSRELEMALDLASGAEADGDFAYLKQAVMIGLDNAIKHSPPGGRLQLSTALEGGQVVIRIADQGPGVNETDRPHVFERFYRGALEDELLNPGFGIGLSIAKDIIERHNGSLSLDNRPEGGAVFTICLPRRAERA